MWWRGRTTGRDEPLIWLAFERTILSAMRLCVASLLAVASACGMAGGCILVRQNDAGDAVVYGHVLPPGFRYTLVVGCGPAEPDSDTGLAVPTTTNPPKPTDLAQVPYVIVIPFFQRASYCGEGDNEFLPATRLTGTGQRFRYPERLWVQLVILPVMGGIWELLPYPETCVIAFAPGCWPVTKTQLARGGGPTFIYLRKEYGEEVPSDAKQRIDLLFFPRSRVMDWEVASASGCSIGKYPMLTPILARDLAAICHAVDCSGLSNEDRELVYGQLLDLTDNALRLTTQEKSLQQLRKARVGLGEKIESMRGNAPKIPESMPTKGSPSSQK